MAAPVPQPGALEWVLAKLSAKTVFKPPELKPIPQVRLVPTAPPAGVPAETAAQKAKRLSKVRVEEEQLWHEWNKSGKKPELFTRLYTMQLPLINQAVGKFRGVEVSKAALRAHATELYYDQLESWDPNHPSGASLKTHVVNGLRGLRRYVLKYQNTARITEPTSARISTFHAARNELTEKLGYDPALHQIVEHTNRKDWGGKKLSMKDAMEVSKSVRKGFDIGAGGEDVEGAGTHHLDPYMQAAHIIYPTLKPHEQKVHELLFPRGGGEPMSPGAIAKKLGWHVSKVSKARTVIFNKITQRVGD